MEAFVICARHFARILGWRSHRTLDLSFPGAHLPGVFQGTMKEGSLPHIHCRCSGFSWGAMVSFLLIPYVLALFFGALPNVSTSSSLSLFFSTSPAITYAQTETILEQSVRVSLNVLPVEDMSKKGKTEGREQMGPFLFLRGEECCNPAS